MGNRIFKNCSFYLLRITCYLLPCYSRSIFTPHLMKKFVLIASALLLVACGSKAKPVTATFSMAFKPTLDAKYTQDLADAAGRTIQGRVESMGGIIKDLTVSNVSKEGAEITFTLTPQEILEPLTAQIGSAYKLRLMREAKPNETADVTVEATGNTPKKGFKETGVTEADIEWVGAALDEVNPGKGAVLMTFTTAGKEEVRKVFSTTKGLSVALFVHDRLISSFMNTNGEARENIFIEGVPALELAAAFADDVNVGTFVTFTKK